MSESLILGLAGLAGAGLGLFFFGGLWWTTRRGALSSRPALWFLGSALLRMGVALAGFYFVGGNVWPRWVACLIGFIVTRLLVTRLGLPRANATGPFVGTKRESPLFHPPAKPAKKIV